MAHGEVFRLTAQRRKVVATRNEGSEMMSPLNSRLIACAAVVAASLSFSTTTALAEEGVHLASHRAAYDVSLASVRDGVGINDVTGQIAYGVEKVCGGWLLAQSGTMNLHLATGEVAPQTVHYSSWEADDASQFRFSVKSGDGTGKSGEDVILGTAQARPNAQGSVSFTRPEPKQFDLPAGTAFPMAHTSFLINAARAGQNQAERYVFEGTDVEGVKLLVAFISPLSEVAKGVQSKLGGQLINRPGWSFRLAYFDPQSQTGEPLYEVEADMLDNGVALRWVVDYGVYAVNIQLNKIERLVKPRC